jgi:hypothetical protein
MAARLLSCNIHYMPYDYERLFEAIVKTVSGSLAPAERMHSLIAECERQRPHADWQRLRALKFDLQLQHLTAWITRATSEATEGQKYRGIWFGLTNPVRSGVTTADVYIAAGPAFSSDSLDWAQNLTLFPRHRYLLSPVLASIYAVAYSSKRALGNDAEYPLVLAYGAMLARAALELNVLPEQMKSVKGAAVGFDSGDFLFLGSFSRGRFRIDVRPG